MSVTRSEEMYDLRVTLSVSLGLSVIIRRRQDAQGVNMGTVPTRVGSRITIWSFSIRVACAVRYRSSSLCVKPVVVYKTKSAYLYVSAKCRSGGGD